jgi:hypothetical protein
MYDEDETRIVAHLEKAIMMGLETVRGMDPETYLRLSSAGMMTAEHISKPLRRNIEEANDILRVDTTQTCLNDTH